MESLPVFLQGFEDLYVSSDNEAEKAGHLPFGGTLLISGPPGAGKTTFAIALARELMLLPIEKKEQRKRDKKRILYFISSEITLARLREVFRPLGWFGPEDKERGKSPRLFQLDHTKPDDDNLYVVTPDPATDRPVPTPEELVNDIFGRIAKNLSPSEAEREPNEYIVIVDSITALLKGCVTPADERRQTHELLYRLRALFGRGPETGGLALTILLAEQDHPADTATRTASVEDYLADVVFRLSNKRQPLGRRIRELEIVKSQGVHMISGEHSWAIVTNKNCGQYLRHPVLESLVKAKTFHDGDQESPWGTVVIFARARMLHKSAIPGVGPEPALIRSGTAGLDEMIVRKPEFWLSGATVESRETEGALARGTTTLVAGPLGSGKTTLCLQFLLASDESDDGAKEKYSAKRESLFISLTSDAMQNVRNVSNNPELRTRFQIERFTDIPKDLKKGFIEQPWALRVAVLDFNQSVFDFNHLMAHLQWAITCFKPRRIAFDGLSEWLTTFNKSDAAKMLEAIGVVIGNHGVYRGAYRPTVFMTFDMNTRDDPLEPQAIGINADYIVALKQVNIQDEIRKVIYILKSASAKHDPTLREIAIENGRAYVRSGLDNFNGLLAGSHRPAEVLLQLFQENDAEQTLNRWLNWRLKQLNNLQFKSLDFSRSEIGRMFEDFDSRTRFPAADLKILSVDEWWLASQPNKKEQKDAAKAGDPRPALLDLATLWDAKHDKNATLAPSWRDFWLFEVDKCGPEDEADVGAEREVRYAVPGYMDFGMFCVNRRLLGEFKNPLKSVIEKIAAETLKEFQPRQDKERPGAEHAEKKPKRNIQKSITAKLRSTLLGRLPRYWATPYQVIVGEKQIAWFDNDNKTSQGWPTIVSMMRFLQTREGDGFIDMMQNRWGFAFDMGTRETCVCVFFELAWSFGASPCFLRPAAGGSADPLNDHDKEACVTALKFLMFLVMENLMPVRASVETTRHSLFSRHFYSTLQSALDLDRWDEQDGKNDDEFRGRENIGVPAPNHNSEPSILSIPFFPIGLRNKPETDPGNEWCILLRDVAERLDRLYLRGKRWLKLENPEALKFWEAKFTPVREKFRIINNDDLSTLKNLAAESVRMVADLLNPTPATTNAQSAASDAPPTANDTSSNGKIALHPELVEMMRWHILRLNLLGFEKKSPNTQETKADEPPSQIRELQTTLRGILESFEKSPLLPLEAGQFPSGEPLAPSGFGCTGSWMYGVHQSARSPSLARDILQEITSLSAAEERARRGAGIPTRRDFFELHGQDDVPSMEYLNWNQLLRYCACRARRRERVLPKGMKDPARIYKIIQKQMLSCLDCASLWAHEYTPHVTPAPNVVRKADFAARQAMEVIGNELIDASRVTEVQKTDPVAKQATEMINEVAEAREK